MDLATSAVTSILIIQGNSIEFQTHSGIRMRNTGALGRSPRSSSTATSSVASQPRSILTILSTCFVSATISDNLIGAAAGAGTTAAITVNTVPLSVITDNQILRHRNHGARASRSGLVHLHQRLRVTTSTGVTDVTNAVSSGVASATSIALPNWTDSIVVTGTTNITSIAAKAGRRGAR